MTPPVVFRTSGDLWLRGHPELDDEVIRIIGRLRLAPFFSPEACQGSLICPHDDPGSFLRHPLAQGFEPPWLTGLLPPAACRR